MVIYISRKIYKQDHSEDNTSVDKYVDKYKNIFDNWIDDGENPHDDSEYSAISIGIGIQLIYSSMLSIKK